MRADMRRHIRAELRALERPEPAVGAVLGKDGI